MLSNVSIWQLLIVLVIVIAIFGTKRLKNLGADLGTAIKGFRSAVTEEEGKPANADATEQAKVIEGEVEQTHTAETKQNSNV